MATKLDKAKPYGEIFGDHFAAFEQGGKFFDAQGDEVADPSAKAPELPKPTAPPPKK